MPLNWQGPYSLERAQQWIEDRDNESSVLLVVDRKTTANVGLLILSESENACVRVGYVLAEDWWSKGMASELVRGFVDRSRDIGVKSLVGGVTRDNLPSRRVLEKNGFVCNQPDTGDAELIYELRVAIN